MGYNVWKRVDAAAFSFAAEGIVAGAAQESVSEAAGLSGWPVMGIGDRYLVSSPYFASAE